MANKTFSAQVSERIRAYERRINLVFKASAQDLVSELNDQLTEMVYNQPYAPGQPTRTGFLRASLVVSKEAMPKLIAENPGGTFNLDTGDIILEIVGSEIGDTLYLGYTANYGAFVHYGARGQPPRPWILLVAQRWQQIVDANVRKALQAIK